MAAASPHTHGGSGEVVAGMSVSQSGPAGSSGAGGGGGGAGSPSGAGLGSPTPRVLPSLGVTPRTTLAPLSPSAWGASSRGGPAFTSSRTGGSMSPNAFGGSAQAPPLLAHLDEPLTVPNAAPALSATATTAPVAPAATTTTLVPPLTLAVSRSAKYLTPAQADHRTSPVPFSSSRSELTTLNSPQAVAGAGSPNAAESKHPDHPPGLPTVVGGGGSPPRGPPPPLASLKSAGNARRTSGGGATTDSAGQIFEATRGSARSLTVVAPATLAESIEGQPSLRRVVIEAATLTEQTVHIVTSAIETHPSVQELSLAGNHLGDAGADCVAKLLACNTVLQTLSLKQCKIGNAGFVKLAEALQHNTTLTSLSLAEQGRHDISAEGCEALGTAIQTSARLKHLDLSGNAWNDELVGRLLGHVSTNQSLTSLNLSRVQATSALLPELAMSLAANPNITKLVLSHNPLGPQSGDGLVSVLNIAKLEVLDLAGTHLSPEAVEKLAGQLKTNACLRELILDDNDVDDVGGVSLAEALVSNKSLQSLSLGRANLHEGGLARLLFTLEHRNKHLLQLFVAGNDVSRSLQTKLDACLERRQRSLKCIIL